MTAVLLTAAVGLPAVALWLWVRRRLVVVTVEGSSMQPTLWPGDRVLVRRTTIASVRTGQLVVVRRPAWTEPAGGPPHWVIKRAAAVAGELVPADVRSIVGGSEALVPAGHLVALGDNPAHSGDSRHWGYVTADRFLGVVTRSMRAGSASTR